MKTVLTTCLALAATAAVAGAADWPAWLGPDRDGVSEEAAWTAQWPEGGPPVAWEAEIGPGFAAVAVAGGKVYAMGRGESDDVLYCLSEADGTVLWKQSYPTKEGSYPGPRATPTVDGDRVYTSSRYADLHCFDAASGQIKWSVDAREAFGVKKESQNWGLASSPLIVGDLVVYDFGMILALDKMTGKLKWKVGDDKPGFSSAQNFQLGGKTYVTAFSAASLVIADVATGTEIATFPWETKYDCNTATPLVEGDTLFISSGYGRGCAALKFDGTSLTKLWENDRLKSHCNNAVLYQGHLYGFDGQQGGRGDLVCMELATGEIRWSQRAGRIGALMIAGGTIIAQLDRGELITAKATPAGYTEIARAEVLDGQCWTMPVLANGRIYVRNNKNDAVLKALDVRGAE